MKTQEKIKSFTDLICWKKGHELVKETYSTTSNFPREERYALTSQLRRCVVSITSNIAEGFSRRSTKEKVWFLVMALGSLNELQNQLLVAKDVGYLEEDIFNKLDERSIEVSKLINGAIKSLEKNSEDT
ncbi:MAG: four helix bundle protein [Patescibacteria group bacterium]|nr:four helix bundle protein [Patescibacteria group bacterium]